MTRFAAIAAAAAAAHGLAASVALAQAERATATGPFLGYYEAQLTTAQATARGDSRLAGHFILVLGRNGLYATYNSFDGSSAGRFSVLSGHRLRFHDDIGCVEGGFEQAGGGVYRWSLNGNRLALRLVTEGPCTGRTQQLTYPVWTRR